MLVANLVHLKTMPGMFGFELFQQVSELLDVPCNLKEVINEHLLSCHVLLQDSIPVGRFAIYKNDLLRFQGESAICIGAYECIDDDFVAAELLTSAVDLCKDLGAKNIIGPMHGSTWNRYRFKTSNKDNSFFLDVNNPEYYNKQFLQSGFSEIGQYCSNLDADLKCDSEQLASFKLHFEKKGAIVRNIDMNNLEQELYSIADFCNHAFANNFLFSPIKPKLFVSKYMALGALMDPKFIWIVEDDKAEIHSVCFVVKDVTDPTGKTLIIKTVATKIGSPFRGISTYLCRSLIQLAKNLGYERIVHALIKVDNLSMQASAKFGNTYCKYSLYGKSLK